MRRKGHGYAKADPRSLEPIHADIFSNRKSKSRNRRLRYDPPVLVKRQDDREGGIITSAAVVTAFLTGWPSIIAVILNYLQRHEVRGTYLESHFSWQIRTFWYSLLWVVIAAVLFLTVVGIPIALVMIFIVGLWVIYRMTRGVLRLMDGRDIDIF